MNRPPAPTSPDLESPGWSIRDAALAVVIAQIVLIVGGSAVVGFGGWEVDAVPIGATLAATVPFWAAIAAAAVVLSRRPGAHPFWRTEFRPVPILVAAIAGAGVQLVAVPAVYSLIYRVTSFDSVDLEEPAQRLGDSAVGGWGAVALVVVAVIGAPLFEEILYRGVFLPPLVDRWGRWGAIVAAAVVFTLFHFQTLQIPGLLLLGVTAGWFRCRPGGLAAAVAVHASFNLVTVVHLLA